VAFYIRVLRDLRACQCCKGRDYAKSEWGYASEKDCPSTGVTGPGRRRPPCPPPPPRVAHGDRAQRLPGIEAPRCPARDRACAPASVTPAGRRLLTPSTGADTGAPSRGGRSHPRGRAPCRPLCPPRTGGVRGGVTAPPVGAAPRQRAAAAAVAAAPPLSPPHAPPATATWLHVPLCVLAAMEPAGVRHSSSNSGQNSQYQIFPGAEAKTALMAFGSDLVRSCFRLRRCQ